MQYNLIKTPCVEHTIQVASYYSRAQMSEKTVQSKRKNTRFLSFISSFSSECLFRALDKLLSMSKSLLSNGCIFPDPEICRCKGLL